MKKVIGVMALVVMLGCAGEGKKVPEECAWKGDCPSGWTKDGNTCVYNGDTVSIEGTVKEYVFGTKVDGAVVKIMDYNTLIPPCGVSDSNGFVRIEGIPKGTDVTAVVSAGPDKDAFGNPTYYFHFVGEPIENDVTGETFVHISASLASIILAQLQKKDESFQQLPDHGVVAGLIIEDPTLPKYVEGATVAISPADDFTKYFYVSKDKPMPNIIDQTDSAGTFIVGNAPPGEAVITAYAGTPTAPIGSTNLVIYENSVAIANILKK